MSILAERNSKSEVASADTVRDQSVGRQAPAAPAAYGIGIDLHFARGRVTICQAGAALFNRQGFKRPAAPRPQGILPGKATLPTAPYRYSMEIPRHDSVSRRDRETDWPRADRLYARGRDCAEHQSDRLR